MVVGKKKGYVYTLEMLIATTLIVVSAIFIFGATQAPTSADTALIRIQGFAALYTLDQRGTLRSMAMLEDKKGIEKELRDILPPGIALRVDVCTYACSGNLPQGKTVVSVDYYISGYMEMYSARKVRLWMWENF